MISFNEKSISNHIGKVGEKHLQQQLGGKLTPGSRVGDLQYEDELLVEKKSTVAKSISLKQDYLVKIDRIAFENDRVPAVVVEFETLKKTICPNQWAIVPLHYLKELLELKNN